MIIAQISDVHLSVGESGKDCPNTLRLGRVVDAIRAMRAKPNCVLVTGDLVDQGAGDAYASLKDQLSRLPMPYHLALGNHDDREAFKGMFPSAPSSGGFTQYTIDNQALRIIVLDTLSQGRHGGAFCEARAAWLKAHLSEQPDKPTLIALHHPPISTGIGWMTAAENDEWVCRLRNVISGFGNVVHVIAGHIHCPLFTGFAGTSLSVCPAVAPQVHVDLSPIDPNEPDGRVLLNDGGPGYALHRWDGRHMTSYNLYADGAHPIVHYDSAHAGVVKETLDLN